MTEVVMSAGRFEFLLEDLVDLKTTAVELGAPVMIIYCLDMAILEMKTSIDGTSADTKTIEKQSVR